jgi:N6-adenosine-specific RNA methylase IME4
LSQYQLLPVLAPEDYARLRADISERGVLVPIEIDEDGNVLDGHNRKAIADELGVHCPTVVRKGMAEHEKRLHVVSLNLARRHLTDAQKVLLGRQIEPDAAEAARLRMLAGKAVNPPVDTCPQGSEKTRDDVATRVGMGSGRTYERGKKLIETAERLAPDVVERMASGELTLREAAKEVRQATKAIRVAEISSAPVAELPTDETFPVLLADPPWRYDYAEDKGRQIENHYPTMTLDDIAAIDVPAADDAVLFCWATSPKLQEAFDVIDGWGFTYRTCMVWVKDKIGMGYYARQQHELLLIATRGHLPVPDPSDRPSSVFHGRRTEHSSKPSIAHEMIETMYPTYRRCELFARTPREGWTVWGNQAGDAA